MRVYRGDSGLLSFLKISHRHLGMREQDRKLRPSMPSGDDESREELWDPMTSVTQQALIIQPHCTL